MKKQITILLMLSMFLTYAQPYNKVFIEGEVGLTKLKDFTYIAPLNVDLGVRYMINPKVGVKLNANYVDHKGYTFYSAGLNFVTNIGRVLNFESFTKSYTVLAGVGGAYTYSDSPLLYKPLSNAHFSAFADNIFKVNNRISIKAGIELMGHINSRHFVENHVLTTTTSILNYNVGVNIALGKHKQSADWYIEEHKPIIDTIMMQPTIIDKTVTNTEYDCNCDANSDEYVFFDNDKYEVTKDALNSITKIASILYNNDKKVTITGFASLPASEEHNFELAEFRCDAVKSKLMSLGIEENRIIINPIGETDTHDSRNVDLARRVLLEIE